MHKLIYFYSFLFARITTACFGQVPKVSSGTIKQFPNFPSKFVAARNIDVWLPTHYDKNKKYPVLYMADGKGLFDSTIMWNNQEWGVDETMAALLKENKIKECIVVGIWNSEATRQTDYFPQKAFELLTPKQQADFYAAYLGDQPLLVGKVQSDNYLKFLVQELKLYINNTYSVFTDVENTFVAGSSYGGLISLYAICEYPYVFGGAACLSTHWPGILTTKDNPIPDAIITYLKGNLPDPKNHKIYFDCGDQNLDAMYPPIQKRVDSLMVAKGFNATNWKTGYFPGEGHGEKAWNKRLNIPLEFLFKNN